MNRPPIKNQMMPGVSCDNCGDPWPQEELTEQDGWLRCPICLRRYGADELDAIEAAAPSLEPLTATFGGPDGVRVWRQ